MTAPWQHGDESERTNWYAPDLGIRNEPLILSLLRYRRSKDRWVAPVEESNLISSITADGKQLPILDLDFAHAVVESSTSGHHHLYLDIKMAKWKWALLMLALWNAGVVELGYVVWSLRRGGNFVRRPGVQKRPGAETTYPDYGWLFKKRGPNDHDPRAHRP